MSLLLRSALKVLCGWPHVRRCDVAQLDLLNTHYVMCAACVLLLYSPRKYCIIWRLIRYGDAF